LLISYSCIRLNFVTGCDVFLFWYKAEKTNAKSALAFKKQ